MQNLTNRPDGVVGYHVSLTPIRSWDRAPVWSFIFFFPSYVTLMKLVMWQGYFFVSKKEFHDWVTSGLVMQPVYGVQTENAA